MDSVGDTKRTITSVVSLVVVAVRSVRTAHTLLLTVLVDAPQVVNSIIDGLLVGVPADHGWSKGEESDVLEFQLEHCCTSNTR